jgi:hypothetical protein
MGKEETKGKMIMKFCNNCGTQLSDDMQFCNNCGAKQGAAPAAAPVNPRPVPPVSSIINNSTWDGSVLDTVVNSIVASLIMSLTCGIATPWAICYMMKFVIGHAVIEGKRLRFVGNGGSLFGNWIKWMLLTMITCGIYGFWVTPRMYKWVVSNIEFE